MPFPLIPLPKTDLVNDYCGYFMPKLYNNKQIHIKIEVTFAKSNVCG